MKNSRYYTELAEMILGGKTPDNPTYLKILSAPDEELASVMCGADILRQNYSGMKIHLCSICNGKSGRCTEDCNFCSQSSFSNTAAPVYPVLPRDELIKGGLYAQETPINRYSIVTTGKGLPPKDVDAVIDAMKGIEGKKIKKCVSLGILRDEEMQLISRSGITRYHHNLETSRSLFKEVCTTHSYDERVETIKAAKRAGMEVCAGGLFGIGETDEQILELARDIKALNAASVPLNFLVPIPGTPYGKASRLTPNRCLKIIAFFRYFLPDKEIIICGGREKNLGELHPLIFYAGASGIMTGNYLTTDGRRLEDDLALLEQMGFGVREK
ncbi:MAG: biotin synthase BioB [Deltaproteobacteria bacterium]|nr:biotin synthase BioB [Deltaproteobacteria bacterium]